MLRETFTVETPLTLSDTEKIQTYHQHHSLMKKPTPGTPNTGNPVNADNPPVARPVPDNPPPPEPPNIPG